MAVAAAESGEGGVPREVDQGPPGGACEDVNAGKGPKGRGGEAMEGEGEGPAVAGQIVPADQLKGGRFGGAPVNWVLVFRLKVAVDEDEVAGDIDQRLWAGSVSRRGGVTGKSRGLRHGWRGE